MRSVGQWVRALPPNPHKPHAHNPAPPDAVYTAPTTATTATD